MCVADSRSALMTGILVGVAAYRSGEWTAARELWSVFANTVPNDKAVKIMTVRFEALGNGAAQDWTGVWQVASK
mgnify:CR=1 FL=1